MSGGWWEAEADAEGEAPRAARSGRRWRDKFRDAFRGVKLGIRGHSSFCVHFFFAAMALMAAGSSFNAMWSSGAWLSSRSASS